MALALVMQAAADEVTVLGDVRQVREVTEGADDADRLIVGQVAQEVVEGAAGVGVGAEAEGDRETADLFDEVEVLRAVVLADDVAEEAAEESRVVDERSVLLGGEIGGGGGGAAGHWTGA